MSQVLSSTTCGDICSRIKEGAIDTLKLADNAVTTEKIAEEAVTTEKLGESCVTTRKVAEEAILFNKLNKDVWDKVVGTFTSEKVHYLTSGERIYIRGNHIYCAYRIEGHGYLYDHMDDNSIAYIYQIESNRPAELSFAGQNVYAASDFYDALESPSSDSYIITAAKFGGRIFLFAKNFNAYPSLKG